MFKRLLMIFFCILSTNSIHSYDNVIGVCDYLDKQGGCCSVNDCECCGNGNCWVDDNCTRQRGHGSGGFGGGGLGNNNGGTIYGPSVNIGGNSDNHPAHPVYSPPSLPQPISSPSYPPSTFSSRTRYPSGGRYYYPPSAGEWADKQNQEALRVEINSCITYPNEDCYKRLREYGDFPEKSIRYQLDMKLHEDNKRKRLIQDFHESYNIYNLQSYKHHRLGDVAIKLDRLYALKPTTTNDTSKIKALIIKADQAYVKHEHITGNAFAGFAHNYLEMSVEEENKFKNFDNTLLTSKDLNYYEEAYEYLYIKDLPTRYNNIYDLEYLVAVNEIAKIIKNSAEDPYFNFHSAMTLAQLDAARRDRDFEEFIVAFENVINLKRWKKGISNFFEQIAYESVIAPIEGTYHLIKGTYHLVAHPIDSSDAMYFRFLSSPAFAESIAQQVIKTWHEIPNYTIEEKGEFYGKVVGTLISSLGLPPGAAKTMSHIALRSKALKAAGGVYDKFAFDFAKIEHFGEWNVTPHPLSRARVTDLDGILIDGTPVVKTFRDLHFIRKETFEGETYFRVWGGDAKEFGRFLSLYEPTSTSQAIKDFALLPSYKNYAEFVTEYVFPKGEIVYIGIVGSHGNLPGGGRQVFLNIEKHEAAKYLEKFKKETWRLPYE